MSHRLKPDYIFAAALFIIVLFGLLMVTSASVPISQERFGESYYYLKSQILKGLLPGLALFFIAYFTPYQLWRKLALPIFSVAVLTLIAVFIPKIGAAHGGAQRWLDLGFFSIQPSELLKLSFIIYMAAWLDSKPKALKSFKTGFIPFLILIGIPAVLLIAQPDIGTLGVVALTGVAIYFIAGANIIFFPVIIMGGTAGVWLLTKRFPHAANRLLTFLHPELAPQGISYQINQARLAIGSGGFFGKGLGQGIQKFRYLPEPTSDSILAVISEELGFIGVFSFLFLFAVLIARGFKIAKNAPDNFGRLLAGGIIAWFAIQLIINSAAISGLIPLTGITLPFVSLGGSSLAICLAGAGIVLNISRGKN